MALRYLEAFGPEFADTDLIGLSVTMERPEAWLPVVCPPLPTCPACGYRDGTAYYRNVRRMILAVYDCGGCGLVLHALPH